MEEECKIDRSAIALELFCLAIEKRPAGCDNDKFAKDVKLVSRHLLCRLHYTSLDDQKLLLSVDIFRCAIRAAKFKTRDQWLVNLHQMICDAFPLTNGIFKDNTGGMKRLLFQLNERDRRKKGERDGS